jgi:hypothetical protein
MHAVPFAPKPVGTTGLRPLFRQQGWSSAFTRSGRGTPDVAVGEGGRERMHAVHFRSQAGWHNRTTPFVPLAGLEFRVYAVRVSYS